MDSLKALRIQPIDHTASGFDRFTFPRYRALIAEVIPPNAEKRRVIIGAWLGDTPIGLALYSLPWGEGLTQRRLLSVMVAPLMRRQGLAKQMLQAGNTKAASLGTTELMCGHSSNLTRKMAFEALLRADGGPAPREFEYRLAGRAGWSALALHDWARFLARLQASGYQSTPWTDITAEDRAQIQQLLADQVTEAERAFDPFPVETRDTFLPAMSLVLRKHGAVVGWIVGQSGAKANSVHYSNGYVLPSVRRTGWLVGGVREVCERQAAHLGPQSLSVFETADHNTPMRRFMDRNLKPYAEWTDSRYQTKKRIGG